MMPIWMMIMLVILGLIMVYLTVGIGALVTLIFYRDVRTGKRWQFGPRGDN